MDDDVKNREDELEEAAEASISVLSIQHSKEGDIILLSRRCW